MSQDSFHTDTFQGILNQYLLKFRVEQRLQFKANILLVIAGIYGIAFLNMNVLAITNLQFISLVPLIILYGYSIFIIASPPALWPWVSKGKFAELKNNDNSEQVYKSLVNQIYKLTGEVDKPLKQYLRYLWRGVYLLSLSVLWTVEIYIFYTNPLGCFIIMLVTTAVVLGLGLLLYWEWGIQKVIEKWKNMNE